MKTPFIGAAYTAYSNNLAANRLINLYPEKATDGGKDVAAFFRTPGLRLLATAGSGPIRGSHDGLDGYLYVVSGPDLYKVDTSWTASLIGTVAGSGPVSMDDNGTQIFIACNPDGFIYNKTTLVLGEITDPDFPGAEVVRYIKNYFVFNQPGTQIFWVTQILDGTSIDPLDYASAEGAPDLIVGHIVDHEEAWMFGSNSAEVFYVDANADFPLQRMSGGFVEQGCAAPFSIVKMDNSIFWLGLNDRGSGVVWRANGYTPVRVSTHAIETAMESYSTISDAIAYTYQQHGHTFYVLTFPTANATWCFDATPPGFWHERAYRDTVSNDFGRHRSNSHTYFNRTHVVGDYLNGNLYALDTDTYSDNGDPLKWLRSWRALPTGANTQRKTYHRKLQIDAEVGVGLVTGQGSDPQMMLRWSDDGGYNWSNEHWRTMGAIGERRNRVIWEGCLADSYDRVYEASGTDPIKIALVAAELDYKTGRL